MQKLLKNIIEIEKKDKTKTYEMKKIARNEKNFNS